MKKKLWIWAALFLLLFSVGVSAGAKEPAVKGEHTLLFFYNNVCASCHEEDNFYELFNRCVTSEEKKTISYEIRTYNLFLDADAAVYEKLLAEAGKDRGTTELPVLVVDDHWISGYEAMERGLHEILFGEDSSEGKEMPESEETPEGERTPEAEKKAEEGEKTPGPEEAPERERTPEAEKKAEEGEKSPELEEAPEGERTSEAEKKAEEGEKTPDSGETPEKEKKSEGENSSEEKGEAEFTEVNDAGDEEQQLLLFTTYSCGECEQAKEFLSELGTEEEFYTAEYNVAEKNYVEIFKKLLEEYGCSQRDGKVPAVFAGDRVLIGVKSIREELPPLLEAGEADAGTLKIHLQKIAWVDPEEKPLSEDEADPEEKSSADGGLDVNAAALFGAGLLSGFNPCSISMLLMLFSILLTSHASVLKNGLVYLAGKYVVYVCLGAGIYFAAAGIDQRVLSRYSGAVNMIIVFLFLAVAVLNFMDFLNVRKDEYGKVRMQLPRRLRRFNHGLLKKAQGAEGVFLTFLVLGLGAAVSVGEFFCTGQIYMASILYLLRSGTQTAQSFGALFLYVTAMSIPAAVIVLLIHLTKGTGRVSEFMLRHMGAIKLLNSVLFVLYAVYFLLK